MQFGILGPLVVRSPDGDAIAVGGPRPRALLALLLLDAGRTVSIERLIDGQYGDDPPAGAANAIQAQVSRLRRSLPPPGVIEFHGAGYRLAVDREDVDAHRFERLAREGRRLLANGLFAGAATVLRDALDLWRGPAFADLSDAPFAPPQARRLEELRLAVMEDLAEAELALPATSPVAELRELVAAHPLRERARGLLMRALHAAGRQAEALAVYDDTRRLLAAELGADPSPELAAVHLEILRGERPRERVTRVRPPTQLTSFVGREDELARIAALHDTRLVTIVGPGGTGKTRLAIEATTRHTAMAPACFVDLSLMDGAGPAGPTAQGAAARETTQVAAAREAAQVAAAVLGALGLRESALRPPVAGGPADPADRLVAALAEQDLTLVLDNCEHLITGTATLARRLLASCPRLTILATSREPLGITGEHLVPLAPLPTPPPDAEDPYHYPAVRLFADRAAAVRQGFTVGPHNRAAVLRICSALDGLPLAIELAAARVRTFAVEEIAARLAEHGRFTLLSRGDRTAAARHRTLYAVVEWSWSLLDAEEQALARRFSVFSGGASLAAVEGVCGGAPLAAGRRGGADPAETLAGLVDKSLVETDGERYHMLDTIRLFCAERLTEAGEEERLRQAHAAWFLELAQSADDHLYRTEQLDWMARLSADNANLRAALRWSVEYDRPTAMRLVAALGMYWWLSGRREQATAAAVRLLDAIGQEPPAGMAEEYVMTVLHAVPDAESPHWNRARLIVESLERPMRYRFGVALWGMIAGPPAATGRRHPALGSDPWSQALGKLGEALMALLGGRIAAAEQELEQVLAAFGEVGERWGKAQALDWLALIAGWRGEWARAMKLWEDAIEPLEDLGAVEELVDVLIQRSDAHCRAGDLLAARADCERAADLARRLAWPEMMSRVQLWLGEIARFEGDLAEAARRLDAALSASGETGAFTTAGTRAQVLTALGRLAEANGDAAEAGRRHHQALALVLRSPMATDLANAAEGLAGHALLTGTTPQLGDDTAAADQTPGPEEQALGAVERAALLLGMGVAVRGMAVAGDRDVARISAAATDVLGPEAFAAAFAKGAGMGRDAAFATLTSEATATNR